MAIILHKSWTAQIFNVGKRRSPEETHLQECGIRIG